MTEVHPVFTLGGNREGGHGQINLATCYLLKHGG
jgi:hypothetical protein